jgi:RNA polymerase sigma-70 factor, ECF subfamily
MAEPANERVESPTDEALIRASAAGDREAFGALVDRHHPRALGVAYRLCGDADLARDVVQESFLRILRHAPRYRPDGRFTTFLFAVVRNMVREQFRRSSRRREQPLAVLEPAAAGLAAGAPRAAATGPLTPDAELHRRELGGRLLAALAALPEELRAAFVLSELEQLPYAEIARICGCPVGTVASRKHASIERLRRLLEPLRGDV